MRRKIVLLGMVTAVMMCFTFIVGWNSSLLSENVNESESLQMIIFFIGAYTADLCFYLLQKTLRRDLKDATAQLRNLNKYEDWEFIVSVTCIDVVTATLSGGMSCICSALFGLYMAQGLLFDRTYVLISAGLLMWSLLIRRFRDSTDCLTVRLQKIRLKKHFEP